MIEKTPQLLSLVQRKEHDSTEILKCRDIKVALALSSNLLPSTCVKVGVSSVVGASVVVSGGKVVCGCVVVGGVVISVINSPVDDTGTKVEVKNGLVVRCLVGCGSKALVVIRLLVVVVLEPLLEDDEVAVVVWDTVVPVLEKEMVVDDVNSLTVDNVKLDFVEELCDVVDDVVTHEPHSTGQ